MRASVVRLRRRGTRLAENELEPAVLGDLEVDIYPSKDPKRHPRREARLVVVQGVQPITNGVLAPLFNASITRFVGQVMTLHGIELASDGEGRIAEHVQVWRCTLHGG